MPNNSDICRICLKKRNVMYSIFDKYSDEYNQPMCDMIMYCTSVIIEKEDGLPNLVCRTCKARLGTTYLFKRECEESDNKLRQKRQTVGIVQINGVNYRLLKTENDDFSQMCQLQNVIKTEDSDDDDKMDVTEDIQQSEFDADKLTPNESPPEAATSLNTPCTVLVKEELEELEKVIPKKKLKKPEDKKPEDKKPEIKKPKNYYCYGCSVMFSTKAGLDTHMSENHPDQNFVCDYENCNKEFTDWLKYSGHLKLDHSIENCFICQQCRTSYQKKKYLDRHIIAQHGDRLYVCEHCSERCQTAKALERHVNMHTEKYKCKFCDKCFPSEFVLKTHLRIHNIEDSYSCEDCDEKFSTKLFLKRHICKKNRKAEENKKVKNHLCPYCAHRFSRRFHLASHILLHTGIKPFKCDYCQYRGSTKELLASHVRTHTGERPYKCNFCGKGFRQKSSLTIHERFHTGHRPYVCSTCQKGFTSSNDLKVHERTHSGIKLFSCDVCNSSFTTKHYLGVHQKKHSN